MSSRKRAESQKHGTLLRSLNTFVPKKHSLPLLRWIVHPIDALKILVVPLALCVIWGLLSPSSDNPFRPFFLISGKVSTSTPDDPRYQKTWWDLLFVSYYVVVFALIRESINIVLARPAARYFGIRRPSKIQRFAEQTYALIYFTFFGTWGYRIMKQLPTYWFNTRAFWINYPHWDMKPELKAYYLVQAAYWTHQLLVTVLGMEKPRKDFRELVAHHLVTLWMVGGSYLINLTLIGNAVYLSMDIPDAVFALAKLLNYMKWKRAKIVAFVAFVAAWSYFRHYLNLWILWSVLFESHLLPEAARHWSWTEGVYLPSWMIWQIFAPILFLQFLNLFWYFLILRILVRAFKTSDADDDRSDDEDEGEKDE